MAISIRLATFSEREICVRLLTAQLVEHNLPVDPVGIAHGVDLAFAPHSAAWLLLAERDGASVGIVLANQIVSVEKCGYTLWIEELYVVPEARRRRVASALLDYVVAEGRRRGVRAIELEVVRLQTAAFAFYRTRGFYAVHRQRLTLDL